MTIDRNTIATLHKKGHSNFSIARSCIRRETKQTIRTKIENKQSELRLKCELATTRIELDLTRKVACRMRSYRG